MGKATEITQTSFQSEVLESSIPVLVDFWAPWCGPCRRIAPLVEQLVTEYAGKAKIAKVDVDQCQELAGSYGVMNIPTLMVFKGGEVVERFTGIPDTTRLKDAINQAIG